MTVNFKIMNVSTDDMQFTGTLIGPTVSPTNRLTERRGSNFSIMLLYMIITINDAAVICILIFRWCSNLVGLWYYAVPSHYKRDFIHLQATFGSMFMHVSKGVKSCVSVGALKEYLSSTFADFQFLQDANTIEKVMQVVRNKCSLTDCGYLEEIANHFDLQAEKKKIMSYQEALDSFCRHTLSNHVYVRSFREDYPRYILSCNKITFQLMWKSERKTLDDIRDILYKAFEPESARVQIVLVDDGSVKVVCWAPQYLMEKLMTLARERVAVLTKMGMINLTIGGTKIIEFEVSIAGPLNFI